MTAKGKLVTAQLRAGDRVRIERRARFGLDLQPVWRPAIRKTGSTIATVERVRVEYEPTRPYSRPRRRYVLDTDQGVVPDLAPAQTFWEG